MTVVHLADIGSCLRNAVTEQLTPIISMTAISQEEGWLVEVSESKNGH